MKFSIMDYETLKNCFIAVFLDLKEKKLKSFIISPFLNQINEYLDYIEKNKYEKQIHVSFNGLAFDAQITQHILDNIEHYRNNSIHVQDKITKIYNYAQYTIHTTNDGGFPEYPEYKMQIQQLDLFKMNHWDNAAKRSSLKSIQCAIDWHNVQDMPYSHTHVVKDKKELKEILEYCKNDVLSTFEIFKLSKEQINLRLKLSESYKCNLLSASEPKLARELFLRDLSPLLEVNVWELRKYRTHRDSIKVGDNLLSSLTFQLPLFKSVLESFKNLTVNPMHIKGAYSKEVSYKGMDITYALGGIHGSKKPGVYKSNDDYIIISSDVSSYYPNLAIRNRMSPAHFDKDIFCDKYEWYYDQRQLIPKSNILNAVYKLVLNSTYGQSNEINSPFYDPQYMIFTTVNGQLLLTMLLERLCESIPGSVPMMINTDGLEVSIPRKYYDKYMEICSQWEKETNLILEHDTYKKLILRDCNNYIGHFTSGKIKCKGAFEYENLALHKNKSYLIIRKAIHDYFIHETPVERTIKNSTNIFDFCAFAKIKGDWDFYLESSWSGDYKKEKQQKTLRYYNSMCPQKIIKVNKRVKKVIQLEAGSRWSQVIYNKHEEVKDFSSYKIDYRFYIQKALDQISNIEGKIYQQQELKLF